MTRALADDIVTCALRCGGRAAAHELRDVPGKFIVSIDALPDVSRFVRALRSFGVRGTVSYTAVHGWSVSE